MTTKRSSKVFAARLRLNHAINRSTILFTTGLLGVGHETLIQHAERPTLLILFAAMMGLPAFLSTSNEGGLGFGHHAEDEKKLSEGSEKVTNEAKRD